MRRAQRGERVRISSEAPLAGRPGPANLKGVRKGAQRARYRTTGEGKDQDHQGIAGNAPGRLHQRRRRLPPPPYGLVLQQALSAPQGRVEGKISVPLPPSLITRSVATVRTEGVTTAAAVMHLLYWQNSEECSSL